jgi:filamin
VFLPKYVISIRWSLHISVDAAKAGAGNMEIIVSVDNRNVPNSVSAEGNAKFNVSFTPQEALPHTISVKFNREPVPGKSALLHLSLQQHMLL